MVSVIEFITQLATSVGEMARLIGIEIALRDPLSFVSVLLGALILAFSVGLLGYLALGALGRELGIVTPTPRRSPNERRPRH